MLRVFKICVAISTILLFSGCGSNGSSLEVRLIDAPITVDGTQISKVVVAISDVSVHSSASAGSSDAGWSSISLDNAVNIDLLTLQVDFDHLLGTQALPAGTYQQLRITVASATLTFADDTTAAVTIPSGVVKMNLGVTLEAGKNYGVKLDFDAQGSIKHTGGGWIMAPPVITLAQVYIINSDGTHTGI